MGLDNLSALVVLEEFAKISSAVAFPVFESSVGPVRAIEKFGNEALAHAVCPYSNAIKDNIDVHLNVTTR